MAIPKVVARARLALPDMSAVTTYDGIASKLSSSDMNILQTTMKKEMDEKTLDAYKKADKPLKFNMLSQYLIDPAEAKCSGWNKIVNTVTKTDEKEWPNCWCKSRNPPQLCKPTSASPVMKRSNAMKQVNL